MKMLRNAIWARRQAPAHIGPVSRRATAGLLRMKLHE